jgi:hypothetical protein
MGHPDDLRKFPVERSIVDALHINRYKHHYAWNDETEWVKLAKQGPYRLKLMEGALDVIDAMRYDRFYRAGMSWEEILSIVNKQPEFKRPYLFQAMAIIQQYEIQLGRGNMKLGYQIMNNFYNSDVTTPIVGVMNWGWGVKP